MPAAKRVLPWRGPRSKRAAVGRSQRVGASLAGGAPQAGQIVLPSGTSAEQPAQEVMMTSSVPCNFAAARPYDEIPIA